MIRNKKPTEAFYRGAKEIFAIYRGNTLLWELVTSRSCYSSGQWLDDKPWVDDDKWCD